MDVSPNLMSSIIISSPFPTGSSLIGQCPKVLRDITKSPVVLVEMERSHTVVFIIQSKKGMLLHSY